MFLYVSTAQRKKLIKKLIKKPVEKGYQHINSMDWPYNKEIYSSVPLVYSQLTFYSLIRDTLDKIKIKYTCGILTSISGLVRVLNNTFYRINYVKFSATEALFVLFCFLSQ